MIRAHFKAVLLLAACYFCYLVFFFFKGHFRRVKIFPRLIWLVDLFLLLQIIPERFLVDLDRIRMIQWHLNLKCRIEWSFGSTLALLIGNMVGTQWRIWSKSEETISNMLLTVSDHSVHFCALQSDIRKGKILTRLVLNFDVPLKKRRLCGKIKEPPGRNRVQLHS